mmetsp:Transcript_51795/g.77454  ORF Transcript_51795/g.77454 Transcript_51795/m.77454 type:complete len:181 (+) Transcript_51795:483-1025(+)
MNAWSKSQQPDMAINAYNILQRMISDYENDVNESAQPDIVSVTAFLFACANMPIIRDGDDDDERQSNYERKREALRLAIQTFEDVNSNPKRYGGGGYGPNQYMYTALLKACVRLADGETERGRLCEHVFRQSAERGQVSKTVLNQFLKGAPFGVRKRVLGDNGVSIPKEWSRFVKMSNRP